MFRVIYEWDVPPDSFEEFVDTWSATTDGIHNTVEGALGSFMLRSTDEPRQVLTIAKWRNRSDWEAFWSASNPEQMRKMRSLAERVSVKAFDEVDDRTR